MHTFFNETKGTDKRKQTKNKKEEEDQRNIIVMGPRK